MEKFLLEVQKILNGTQLWIEKQIENSKSKDAISKDLDMFTILVIVLAFMVIDIKIVVGFILGYLFAKWNSKKKEVVAE
jgi:hypothetical protein